MVSINLQMLEPPDPRLAVERYWRSAPLSDFASAREALIVLRQVKPDSTSLIEKIFRYVLEGPVRDAVLYDLIISKSILDLRILHTMNLVTAARRLRWLRMRSEIVMALHPRIGCGSKLADLDPSLFKMILDFCDF